MGEERMKQGVTAMKGWVGWDYDSSSGCKVAIYVVFFILSIFCYYSCCC